jgi:hypothetical protein
VKHRRIGGHRSEGSSLFLNLLSFPHHNTGRPCLFVNIQSRTSLVNDFHQGLLSQLSPEDVLPLKTLLGVLPNQSEATVRGALEHLVKLVPGSVAPKTSRPSAKEVV